MPHDFFLTTNTPFPLSVSPSDDAVVTEVLPHGYAAVQRVAIGARIRAIAGVGRDALLVDISTKKQFEEAVAVCVETKSVRVKIIMEVVSDNCYNSYGRSNSINSEEEHCIRIDLM